MPRVAHEEVSGLKLINLLFRYQLMVHLVCDDRERAWYSEVGKEVRRCVNADGHSGIEAESLIHGVLWAMETTHRPQRKKMTEFTRALYAPGQYPVEKAEQLAKRIAGQLPPKTRHWFDVLNEKVLLAEHPDAPIKALTWLAKMDIFKPAKCNIQSPADDETLALLGYRATLLLQADNWRSVMDKKRAGRGIDSIVDLMQPTDCPASKVLAEVARTLMDTPTIETSEVPSIMDRVKRRTRMLGLEFDDRALLAADPGWWDRKESVKIRHYYAKLRHVLTAQEGPIRNKATVVSLLAAGMVLKQEKEAGKQARYSVIGGDAVTGCSTGMISQQLQSLGFDIKARTINEHLPQSKEGPLFPYLNNLRDEVPSNPRPWKSPDQFGRPIPTPTSST
nr:hypothetical protein [Pseudomonas oleovorans]